MKELHSEAECDITNSADITFRKTQVLRKNIIKYTPHLNDILQLHQFLIYIQQILYIKTYTESINNM